MSLMSLKFGLFFFLLVFVYYIVPKKIQYAILLVGSLLYYHFVAVDYTIIYPVFSVVVTYFAAKYFDKTADDTSFRIKRKIVLIITLCAIVLILVLLKHLNGFLHYEHMIVAYFSPDAPDIKLDWVAPLGISFYTLMLISYLLDTYWGISKAQKNPFKLALYASYFPAINSGPISHYNQIENELFVSHNFSYKNFTYGLQRMLYGLFKKFVIADRLAAITAPIYADTNTYSGGYIWVAIILTVFLIYTDFSGNMDFILGVSECFGIILPENFKSPFFSLTMQELWQRWHITLGLWLKDYIMYPLLLTKAWARLSKWCKKRFSKRWAKIIPTFLAMLILWLVQGVWHGVYPRYMAPVLWFWLVLFLGNALHPTLNKVNSILKINTECYSWKLFQRIRTFLLCAIGIVFFANDGIHSALKMFWNMRTINPWVLFSPEIINLYGGWVGLIVTVLGIIIVLKIDSYDYHTQSSVREWLAQQNLLFRWILLFAMIVAVIIFGIYGPGFDVKEFIYAGF